jgi:hypothetical protein
LTASNVPTTVAAFFFAMRPSFRLGRVPEVSSRESPRSITPIRHYDARVRVLRRIAIVVSATVAVIAYVWIAAVRAVPGVRRRKAKARARRHGAA